MIHSKKVKVKTGANIAVFSEYESYRYWLKRYINTNNKDRRSSEKEKSVLWLLLNPSTADQDVLDPTLTRCAAFSKAWQYPIMEVCNIFAYRATDPKNMKIASDPIGELNDDFILWRCKNVDKVVFGWGNHGAFKNRAKDVLNFLVANTPPAELSKYVHLGMTKIGQPVHPLYRPKDKGHEVFFDSIKQDGPLV